MFHDFKIFNFTCFAKLPRAVLINMPRSGYQTPTLARHNRLSVKVLAQSSSKSLTVVLQVVISEVDIVAMIIQEQERASR